MRLFSKKLSGLGNRKETIRKQRGTVKVKE